MAADQTKIIEVTIPVRVVNTSNIREYWRKKARRTTDHRKAAMLAVKSALIGANTRGSIVVTLTRLSPREFDFDGLVTAMKPIRDGVADGLGLKNDKESPALKWDYDWRKDKTYGVAVRIEFIGAERG